MIYWSGAHGPTDASGALGHKFKGVWRLEIESRSDIRLTAWKNAVSSRFA